VPLAGDFAATGGSVERGALLEGEHTGGENKKG